PDAVCNKKVATSHSTGRRLHPAAVITSTSCLVRRGTTKPEAASIRLKRIPAAKMPVAGLPRRSSLRKEENGFPGGCRSRSSMSTFLSGEDENFRGVPRRRKRRAGFWAFSVDPPVFSGQKSVYIIVHFRLPVPFANKKVSTHFTIRILRITMDLE